MNPNEYDQMVEHLASEIVEDAFEKEATARKGRIENFYEAMRNGEANQKILNSKMDWTDARMSLAEARDRRKAAKISGDGKGAMEASKDMRAAKRAGRAARRTQLNPITQWQAARELADNGNWLPGVGKSYDRVAASNKALYDMLEDRRAAKVKEKTAAIIEDAFEKEAGIMDKAKSAIKNGAGAVARVYNAPGKAISKAERARAGKAWNDPTRFLGNPEAARAAKKISDRHNAAADFWGKNSWLPSTALLTATAAGAGAGIAAHKAKKKKEEAQEKAAAYFEDAQMLKEAAENVWDYADYADSYDEYVLLKQAAEEAYDDAEAQEEAAINVYNNIEDAYDDAYEEEYLDEE